MLLATALALLITGCAQQTFTVQNKTGSSSTKGNHHPSFLRFWNWAEENSRWHKICGGAENTAAETQQNIRKWIARFYYFRHLVLLKRACVLLTIIAWVAQWQATLSALLINILLGSFQLFLHSDQPLWGWKQPVHAGLSGGGCIIHAGVAGFGTHWLTDCFDATDDDQRQHHHAEHHFQLQHQLTLRVFHRAQQHRLTHLHVSNCRVRQLQFSGILSRWALQVMALSR